MIEREDNPDINIDLKYRTLVMELTNKEKEDRENIGKSKEGKDKERDLKKWEHDYYWRRLINADYFKFVKVLITEE